MHGWWKVTLPAEETGIGGKSALLQKLFEELFTANRAPEEAALFTDHDDSLRNYFYYFTPAAADIARTVVRTFDGVECPAPRLHDKMALLVGHSGARESLLRAS